MFTSTPHGGDHGYATDVGPDGRAGRCSSPATWVTSRPATSAAASPSPTGSTTAAAAAWKQVAEHLVAQERGRETWYDDYTVRIATVEREYGMA